MTIHEMLIAQTRSGQPFTARAGGLGTRSMCLIGLFAAALACGESNPSAAPRGTTSARDDGTRATPGAATTGATTAAGATDPTDNSDDERGVGNIDELDDNDDVDRVGAGGGARRPRTPRTRDEVELTTDAGVLDAGDAGEIDAGDAGDVEVDAGDAGAVVNG